MTDLDAVRIIQWPATSEINGKILSHMEEKTLKYFLDNKNFARTHNKPKKKQGDVLTVVDDQIVINSPVSEAYDDEPVTSYTYMKKKGVRRKWSEKEEDLFYKSLECCGCDFSMMNLLFPDRPRSNLRQKYKKELKTNQVRVENALNNFKKSGKDKFNLLMNSMPGG